MRQSIAGTFLKSVDETVGLAVVLLHHLDQVKHLVAVANLVVIP